MKIVVGIVNVIVIKMEFIVFGMICLNSRWDVFVLSVCEVSIYF